MNRLRKYILIALIALAIFSTYYIINFIENKYKSLLNNNLIRIFIKSDFEVPNKYSNVDKNNNGIADPIDIVNSARKEVQIKTKYKSNYYYGGYPPEGEGVCTDVIWRGLKGADIDLKTLMDNDIKDNKKNYVRIGETPDTNIDFRRVQNQNVFFQRKCIAVTTELKARDRENLQEWQPGDIVVFLEDYEHVAIVSDKRDEDGIPYVIHNTNPNASEVKLSWFKCPINAHYRWKY
ncbi:DUF1287 domain-containing protein [Clostridium folliculivorans]|uniref:DUF1287 domain-containing protein n=1 Tax=Clostridium folliculivorans TaxID=2886038 RepID=A0A9W6DBC7_9CLOT|nr:DUF1287 domain-containing protein [Clostridium folliculivorans]GKU26129.1 DUF1287 domain-containing protein [Clostridium folliculivorans]GKU28215.1 DUF1287 domain-containing protein [Clostridium folliculivorans]